MSGATVAGLLAKRAGVRAELPVALAKFGGERWYFRDALIDTNRILSQGYGLVVKCRGESVPTSDGFGSTHVEYKEPEFSAMRLLGEVCENLSEAEQNKFVMTKVDITDVSAILRTSRGEDKAKERVKNLLLTAATAGRLERAKSLSGDIRYLDASLKNWPGGTWNLFVALEKAECKPSDFADLEAAVSAWVKGDFPDLPNSEATTSQAVLAAYEEAVLAG